VQKIRVVVIFYDSCTIVRMDIIVDTNIFLAVALNEPEKEKIISVTVDTTAIAPEIIHYEIGNALSAMVKRSQVSIEEALLAKEAADKIAIRLVPVDIRSALELALEHNIYAYDAYFLQCAIDTSCAVLTLDKQMKRIASSLNIKLLEF